jgi:hypothetical protein
MRLDGPNRNASTTSLDGKKKWLYYGKRRSPAH